MIAAISEAIGSFESVDTMAGGNRITPGFMLQAMCVALIFVKDAPRPLH